MQGRWTIRWDSEQSAHVDVSGRLPWPSEPVPVVPCDDAAIERAARALHRARGLSDGSFGTDAYCECREFAEAALRAAGETP